MILEVTSIANFICHVARCSDIVSEEQLKLLNFNLIQTLVCLYTEFWDINNVQLHKEYRQIKIDNNEIDSKIQKAIINSHFKLESFSSYFTKSLIIDVFPQDVNLNVKGVKYNLFCAFDPPIAWELSLEEHLTYVSSVTQSSMDEYFRQKSNFQAKYLKYNTMPLLSNNNLKNKQIDKLARNLCTWV